MSDQIPFDDLCETTRQAIRLAEQDPQKARDLFEGWSEAQGRALGIHEDLCEACAPAVRSALETLRLKHLRDKDPPPAAIALAVLHQKMKPDEYVSVEEIEAEARAQEEEWRAKIKPFIERHPELALERWGFPPDFEWYSFQAAAASIASLVRRAIMKDGGNPRSGYESDVVLLDDGRLLVAGRERLSAENVRREAASWNDLWLYDDEQEIAGIDPAVTTLVAWLIQAAKREPKLFRRFICEPLDDGRDGVRLRYVGVKEQPRGGWETE